MATEEQHYFTYHIHLVLDHSCLAAMLSQLSIHQTRLSKEQHCVHEMLTIRARTHIHCTIIWEIFVVKMFSQGRPTSKIKRINIYPQCTFYIAI